MIAVKAIYSLIGKEKFQKVVNDWFKLSPVVYKNASLQIEMYLQSLNMTRPSTSILSILEQVYLVFESISMLNKY